MVSRLEVETFWRTFKLDFEQVLKKELSKRTSELAKTIVEQLDKVLKKLLDSTSHEQLSSWSIKDVLERLAESVADDEEKHWYVILSKFDKVLDESLTETINEIFRRKS